MVRVLKEADYRVEGAVSPEEQNRWIVFHTYAMTCYAVSLRGNEGLLIDLSGLNRKWSVGGNDYVVIALLGKIRESQGIAPTFSLVSQRLHPESKFEKS
jgi:hypothetical protein